MAKNIKAELERYRELHEHDKAAAKLMDSEGISFSEAWRRVQDAKERR